MTKTFTRIVSILLIPTFLLSGISFATPQEKAPELTTKEIVTNPDNIVIPREFGLVKSKYKADNGKLVIHIQDAHCNYEAQSNIAKIVEALVKNDGLKFVAVEGADGVIDTSWFKAFPDDAVRKEVADYFMKKGEITGPEFLSITTDYPIKLFGAETRAYYLQNLNAFTSSYPLKAETEKYFNTIKAALNKLKGFIYSDELKLIDLKDAEYEAKKLQFNEYVRFLQAEAEKNKINLREYENLFKLVNVLIYEKKIDFNVTDKERTDLIDSLTKKLSKEGITQLVTQSISFKMGKISASEYYNYLKSLANANGVDLAKTYPNLYNYIIYNSVYSKIENEKLFQDITAVESAIKEKLFKNDDQRALERLSRHIDTLIGLVNIKLLNGDFEYYKDHKEEFSNEVFSDFIQKKAAQYGLAIEIGLPADAVTRSITKLEDFYAIAIKRDKALVDNTLAEMNREGQKIAVLVTGGFHSEGIAKLLEQQAISYMVVCPSITKDVATPYIQVLTNQRTSFEDIVMGAAEPVQQGMLAPASIAWLLGLSDEELQEVYRVTSTTKAALEESLQDRVERVKKAIIERYLPEWLERAFHYAGDGLHRLGQQEAVMQEAFIMAFDNRLAALVKYGFLNQESAEALRAKLVAKDPATGKDLLVKDLADEFQRAFALVQSNLQQKGVVAQADAKLPGHGDATAVTGEELTPLQHAEVNRIIRDAFARAAKGHPDAAMELKIDNPDILKVIDPRIRIYLIPGLEQCDSYLIGHPGRGSEALDHKLFNVYMSPSRHRWIRGLSIEAQKQFFAHESAHPILRNDNPDITEEEVQKRFPITLVVAEAQKPLTFDIFLRDLGMAATDLTDGRMSPVIIAHNVKAFTPDEPGLYASAIKEFHTRFPSTINTVTAVASVERPDERKHDMPGFLGIMDKIRGKNGVIKDPDDYASSVLLVVTDGGAKTRFAYKILSEGYAGLLRLAGPRVGTLRELGIYTLLATLDYLPSGHNRFLGWSASDNFAIFGNARIGNIPLTDERALVRKLADAAVVKGGVSLRLFAKNVADAINILDNETVKQKKDHASEEEIRALLEVKFPGEYGRIKNKIEEDKLYDLGALAVDENGKLVNFIEKEKDQGKLILLFAKYGGMLYKNPFLEILDKDFADMLYRKLRETPAVTPGVGTLDRLPVSYMQSVYQSRFITSEEWGKLCPKKGIHTEDWSTLRKKIDEIFKELRAKTGKGEIYVIDYGAGNEWIDLANLDSFSGFLEMIVNNNNIRKILGLPEEDLTFFKEDEESHLKFEGMGRRLIENSIITGGGTLVVEENVLISGSSIFIPKNSTVVIKSGTMILNSYLEAQNISYKGEGGKVVIDGYFADQYPPATELALYPDEWVGSLKVGDEISVGRNILSMPFKDKSINQILQEKGITWAALVAAHPLYLGQFTESEDGGKQFIQLEDDNIGGVSFDVAQTKVDYMWLESLKVNLRSNIRGAIGAIRMNGGALSEAEHRGEEGVNAALASFMNVKNVRAGNVYALARAAQSTAKPGDIEVELGPKNTSGLNNVQLSNLSALMADIQGIGVSFIVIRGLKESLKVAADLIFHPGIGRRAVYIDEGDLNYLLSLPGGDKLVMEAVNHEIEHINNPTLSEAEIEKMAPSYNVRIALMDRELSGLEELAQRSLSVAAWGELVQKLMIFSQYMHTLPEAISLAADKDAKARFDRMLVRESILSREVAGKLLALNDAGIIAAIETSADSMMATFLDGQVAKGAMTRTKADNMFKTTRTLLKEWLNPGNKIPPYMVQGIYRAMLEGRSADILYSFGAGWREFGTAGIRNPAMQSSFAATQQLELEEFAADPYAPILPGPNLIGAVTLLQQEASIALIMKDLQSRIKQGDPTLASLDQQFLKDVANNRVTIAYDSRINGEYFAKLLAAAFLQDGIQVDLFDNAAGVPHLAWAANREHSAFGILISASHSEANYNGFKAFLGFQMSQVDKTSKDLIVDAREKAGYGVMRLDLARPETDLGAILRGSEGLRWIADRPAKGKDYLGKPLISFYQWYYTLVKERSPFVLLPESVRRAAEAKKLSAETLKVLYTAFFGVGAVPAANFPGFLKECNYGDVDTVKAQTDVMNGMFPGHTSPDPGIVRGWMSNLVDYFVQNAGTNLAGIDKAIAALNEREVGIATDPDIDRAGVMIALPQGVRGNIKEPLIAAIASYIEQTDQIPQAAKQALTAQVTQAMRATLNDKFLMTANDAWTFMMYWKLKMMEENGKLEKDRVYIIEKSHVTTSALERVAELYRNKGYQVYVVDTYVGFTEIGKKGRDLFAIAKLSWDAYNTVTKQAAGVTPIGNLPEIIKGLEKANAELKANVPYQTAGVPIITATIAMLKQFASGDRTSAEQLAGNLNALSRLHILAGVEESNGYGELGRWNRDTQSVELNHISDKDGSLAAFEFLEILSYGKYLNTLTNGRQPNKTAYDMYQDMTNDIGMVCTVNSALYHPGLTGVMDKLNEIEGLEKLFAYAVQQRLDSGEAVTLFNGRYAVNRVEVFRDKKNDNNYLGLPEEGIRLYVTTKAGSEVVVTYRPSGTGDSNRDYNWLLGRKPSIEIRGADFEQYKKTIEDEMAVMVRDFFGIEGKDTGYVDLPPAEFHGLLMALKEGGLQKQLEVFGKAFSQGPIALTENETQLYGAVTEYVLAARKDATDMVIIAEKSRANREAWANYLASPEVAAAPNKVSFEVNGKAIVQIPRAAMIAWQAGLVDYLVGLIVKEGPTANFSILDKEITTLIDKRLPEALTKESIREKAEAPKKAKIKAAGAAKVSGKSAEDKARQEIYDNYIREDEEALRSTLIAIRVDEQRRKKPAIIVYDTGIEPEAVAAVQAGEAKVKEYLGGTLGEVRGTGKILLKKLRIEAQSMAARLRCNVSDIAIVSIIGDDSRREIEQQLSDDAEELRKEGKAGTSLQDELGKIINVAPNEKSKYVPVIALYDVALRWAYGLDLQQIADRLSRFASNTTDPNGGPFTVKDLEKGIIRILPRIGPVNTADAVEAYKAAQQALQSL